MDLRVASSLFTSLCLCYFHIQKTFTATGHTNDSKRKQNGTVTLDNTQMRGETFFCGCAQRDHLNAVKWPHALEEATQIHHASPPGELICVNAMKHRAVLSRKQPNVACSSYVACNSSVSQARLRPHFSHANAAEITDELHSLQPQT